MANCISPEFREKFRGLFRMIHTLRQVFHQHIPYGDDVAKTTGKHEEMENRMHESSFVEAIENGPRDVTHPFSDNPRNGSCAQAIE